MYLTEKSKHKNEKQKHKIETKQQQNKQISIQWPYINENLLLL